MADRTTLMEQLSVGLAGLGRPRTVHDPGRVLVDLAVAVADGAECISDIAVLADQPGLFGPVASDSTVWRLLDRFGEAVAGLRAVGFSWGEVAARVGVTRQAAQQRWGSPQLGGGR